MLQYSTSLHGFWPHKAKKENVFGLQNPNILVVSHFYQREVETSEPFYQNYTNYLFQIYYNRQHIKIKRENII